jgi:2-polyprenyl-3-methyl-5-hydroxy-6-metoxy-1,4-benzoquinol methylase
MVLQRLSRLARGKGRSEEEAGTPAAGGTDAMPVTAAAATWALRLLIGREPGNEAELSLHRQHKSLGELRSSFMDTPEFKTLLARHAAKRPGYAIPPFLARPPADPTIPWRFEPPTLANAVSQLCTASQFAEPAFGEFIADLKLHPGHHRKLWEHAYILSVMLREGVVGPGRKAMGFGCGKERIPAFLAARGVQVLATDAPSDELNNQGWATTNQYANQVSDLFFEGIIGRKVFERLVSFRPVDMNAIPEDLAGQFDACWSTCSLEHLGSLKHGLDFIENSLTVLRPGGLAVHTTEFNLGSNDDTIETPGLSIYRRRDIEELAARLVAAGHRVAPLNFYPGHEELDEVIDVPPYSRPHLKLLLGHYTLTSIGIIVRKKM